MSQHAKIEPSSPRGFTFWAEYANFRYGVQEEIVKWCEENIGPGGYDSWFLTSNNSRAPVVTSFSDLSCFIYSDIYIAEDIYMTAFKLKFDV